jgi:hypothetical protein
LACPVLVLAPAEGGADEATPVALAPVPADASGELRGSPPVLAGVAEVPAVVGEDGLCARNGIIA